MTRAGSQIVTPRAGQSFSGEILHGAVWQASKATAQAKYRISPMGYWNRQAYGSNSPNARGRRQALDRTFLLKTGACPLPQIISNADRDDVSLHADKVDVRCAC